VFFYHMNWLNYAAIYLFFWQISNYVFKLFLSGLDKLGRKRIIKDRIDDEDYLERYYLFLKNRKTFPFNIFLHKFLKSDDEELHDHPWSFTTIILSGGYWEHSLYGKTWHGPGSIIHKQATDLHRLELDPDVSDTWTLFIPGKRCRNWGFQTAEGWINEKDYLEERKKVK
jgi:hypothetical protein